MARSVKDLRGFQKVLLQPGEQKEIVFSITPEDLKFYNADLKHEWEPGDFNIQIGCNSRDVQSATVNWERDPFSVQSGLPDSSRQKKPTARPAP